MILEVENLDLFYGDAQALDAISLGAEEGELVAIVGANGAGKSSLIRTIAGIESPARGTIRFRGRTSPACRAIASAISASARSRRGGRSSPRSPSRRTWRWARCCPAPAAAMRETMAEVEAMFPRLAERRSQPAGTMSGGEQQMLAIGRCLMGRPELIMFDEPSLGLAPALVQELFRTIRALNAARPYRAAGRAERGRIPEARKPRLRAGERPHRHVRHRAPSCSTDDRVRQAYLGVDAAPQSPLSPSYGERVRVRGSRRRRSKLLPLARPTPHHEERWREGGSPAISAYIITLM